MPPTLLLRETHHEGDALFSVETCINLIQKLHQVNFLDSNPTYVHISGDAAHTHFSIRSGSRWWILWAIGDMKLVTDVRTLVTFRVGISPEVVLLHIIINIVPVIILFWSIPGALVSAAIVGMMIALTTLNLIHERNKLEQRIRHVLFPMS